MGPRTRSSAHNSPVKGKPQPPASSTIDETSLPKLFVLPQNRSPEARFLLLPDPRDRSLRRYFFDPRVGPYELTKVHTDSLDPRSVLFTSDGDESQSAPAPLPGSLAEGYVLKTPEIFVATPVDVIFLALPLLCPSLVEEKGSKRLLQSIDDLLDAFEGLQGHLRFVRTNSQYQPMLEKSLEAICDTVDAGEEKMFRLNEKKLAEVLFAKAQRVVSQGLPSSLEDRFVTRVLEVPMMSIHREETGTSFTVESPANDENAESQTSNTPSSFSSGATTAVSETSNTTTVMATLETRPSQSNNTPGSITHLLRLRTALTFLTTSYLPQSLSSTIQAHIASLIDFSPLDTHLLHISSLRASALASRSLSDFSRKRGSEDADEDAIEARAEKKRRADEEEKRRKAGESRGVRELKKANVSGMKKMSDFFGKKPADVKGKS